MFYNRYIFERGSTVEIFKLHSQIKKAKIKNYESRNRESESNIKIPW